MAEKLNPLYKLLKTKYQSILLQSWKNYLIQSIKLCHVCQLALKQPIPAKQLGLLKYVSFRSAGYALLIEDIPDQKVQSKRKTYTPVAFGSKYPLPRATLNVHLLKGIFGNLHGTSRVCTRSVGISEATNCPDRQQISHALFPNKGFPASTLECM